jgi:hypothetical protein
MAAVVHPHRLAPTRSPRPELRVLSGGHARRPAPAARPGLVAVAVIVVLLAAVVGSVVALGRGALASWAPDPPGASTSPASASASGDAVVVRPGDTLWSVARRLQPTGDVRPLVDRLVASHGSPMVVPGDRVLVPR